MTDTAVTDTLGAAGTSGIEPRPEHKFTFGLWTVGHPGRDPFGDVVRPMIAPDEIVRRLADLGAYGVSFHDDDLLPPDADASEREAIVKRFRRRSTTPAWWCRWRRRTCSGTRCSRREPRQQPGGAAVAVDDARDRPRRGVRGADLRVLGRPRGRGGASPLAALDRYAEALDFLCAYVSDRGYGCARWSQDERAPRDTFLPTVGTELAFIERLEQPDMVGVNPEVAHETMAGLSFTHGVAQALWAGKLFHIDLNGQKIGATTRTCASSEGIKEAFFLVRLLEESDGVALRRPPVSHRDRAGRVGLPAGCMRTYLALADKARRFSADPAIAEALAAAGATDLAEPAVGPYWRETPTACSPSNPTPRRSLGATTPTSGSTSRPST